MVQITPGGLKFKSVKFWAVDPHSFNADPDPAVFLNADSDPDPGPVPGPAELNLKKT